MCKTFNVKVIHGRPYHPQSQGKDERFNQTLEQQLGKWMTENNTNRWIDVLDSLILCDNATLSKTQNRSPFEIMFFRRPNGFHELAGVQYGEQHEPLVQGTTQFDAWFDTVLFRHQQLQEYVAKRISTDAFKSLERYFRKGGTEPLKIGDKVLRKQVKKGKEKRQVTEPIWDHPSLITEVRHNNRFRLQDLTTGDPLPHYYTTSQLKLLERNPQGERQVTTITEPNSASPQEESLPSTSTEPDTQHSAIATTEPCSLPCIPLVPARSSPPKKRLAKRKRTGVEEDINPFPRSATPPTSKKQRVSVPKRSVRKRRTPY